MSRHERGLRRLFVVAWIASGLCGALNHTVALSVLGRRFDLVLPHLRYGYVMFNEMPRTVRVYRYAGPDGVRRDVAELVGVPAPGYKRARVTIDLETAPRYLRQICHRLLRAPDDAYTFFIEEYRVDVDRRQPARTFEVPCNAHGIPAPR